MSIPSDVLDRVKNYYEKFWERTERPLSFIFTAPQFGNDSWIDSALWEVRKKYGIQGVSRQAVQSAAERIAGLKIKLATIDLSTISQSIHKVASVFTEIHTNTYKGRYELSLASKFMHFCYPDIVPPFDQFAYAALCFNMRGRNYNINRSRPPRNNHDIEEWLKAFWDFHNLLRPEFIQLQTEVINTRIPAQDRGIAKRAITTCKVCDLVLWKWRQ